MADSVAPEESLSNNNDDDNNDDNNMADQQQNAPNPKPRRQPPRMPVTSEATFLVVQAYTPTEAGEIELVEGDTVQVMMKAGKNGMWTGTANGKTGIFPGNCIEKINSANQKDVVTTQPQKMDLDQADMHAHDYRALLVKLNALDLTAVTKWSAVDVVEKFLRLLDLEMYGQVFIDHRINGSVLLTLNRTDLRFLKK